MKKYDMSQIMSDAWATYKKYNAASSYNRQPARYSFGYCLRLSWASAKENAREFAGVVDNVQVAGTLAHPVLVTVDMTGLTVTGDTFPVRQMFREFGLNWDKASKAWTGTHDQLTTLCRKYA